jgi:hypothetical protein
MLALHVSISAAASTGAACYYIFALQVLEIQCPAPDEYYIQHTLFALPCVSPS